MRRSSAAAYILVFAAFVGAPLTHAQSASISVADVREAFEQVEYARVDSLAESALGEYELYEPAELVEIHTLHGLASFYRGMRGRARTQFEAALSLDPELALDPLLVPPHALSFFEEIKARPGRAEAADADEARLRYIVVEDRRPAAVLRSLLVPGWGQVYKDQKLKGATMAGLWVATAGGGLVAHIARQRAEERYLAATGQSAIAEYYDVMNRWHKARNNLLLLAAGVWLYSTVDAAVTGAPRAFLQRSGGFTWSLAPAANAPAPVFRFTFRL